MHTDASVVQARVGEEARVAPLLLRMETITNLHKEGLMSSSEFEQARVALVSEISGMPASNMSVQKAARLKRAEQLRRQVDHLEEQLRNLGDGLPEDYYYMLDNLPPKFTKDVTDQEEWKYAGSGPMQEYYNSVAGHTIENILADKNTVLDAHQNPVGPQYDLPRDGTMQEHTLVLLWFPDQGTYSNPVNALRAKGFRVVVHNSQSSNVRQMMVSLLSADVVWMVSGSSVEEQLFDQLLEALEKFHYRGGGIFVWADNAPYFAHANQLLSRLLPGEGVFLQGNDKGSQIMRVHSDGRSPGQLARNHLIMTGIYSLFEGVTISYLSRVGPLKVLATYNDGPGYSGKPYCAVADAEVYRRCAVPYKMGRGRVVIDGGFTKLYDDLWSKTAGTERYVKNASAWLLNVNSRVISEGECGPRTTVTLLPPSTAIPLLAPSAVSESPARNGIKTYRPSAATKAYTTRFA